MKRYQRNEMSTEQWLELRQQYIGASEVAVVCGLGAFASAACLYAEKKGLRPAQADSGPMRRGRWAEASCFEALQETFPEQQFRRASIYAVNLETRQASTPDGFCCRPDRHGFGAIQAKCISRWQFRRAWLTDPGDDVLTGEVTIPPQYVLQTIQDARLNGCPWAILAVLITSDSEWQLRTFDVELDPVLIERIDFHCAEFLERYLDRNVMPPIDFEHEQDQELISHLYPQSADKIIDLSTDNRVAQVMTDLDEVKIALKRLRKSEAALEAELKFKLGENSHGLLHDGRCLSWRTQTRKAYAVPAGTTRPFRILKHPPQTQTIEEE